MKNLGNMMKQAQEMQAKMAEMQEALDKVEITGFEDIGKRLATKLEGKGE